MSIRLDDHKTRLDALLLGEGGERPEAGPLLRFNPNHDSLGRFTTADNAGGGATAAANAGKTPGGTRYATDARLSEAQSRLLGQIVDYGETHGFDADQIATVVNQAFYESSLGTMTHNPKNRSVIGIFQYNLKSWKDLGHAALNIDDAGDQIHAMYADLKRYQARYAARTKQGGLPRDLSFADYFAIRHNLGNNSQAWRDPIVVKHRDSAAELGFRF